ncbi:MAG: hypothetical protein PHX18_05295 [Candidatus Gastranaerophilales bacterium]|nr:hypothetical protein [Candidatus Gastranaerophilales bacterium]
MLTKFKQNLSLDEVLNNAPIIIKNTMNFLEKVQPNLKNTIKLSLTLIKFMQMVNFKRVSFKELNNHRICNLYLLVFAPSGSGKDKALKNLNTHIFRKVLDEIKNTYDEKYETEKKEIAKKYINKEAKAELKKLRKLTLETNSATPEGICQDAGSLLKVDFGSIFIKISELSSMEHHECKKFLKMIISCYDGDFDSKSIKSEQRLDNISFLPISFVGLSDPSEFFTSLKNEIEKMFKTGLARRAITVFQPYYKSSPIPDNYRKQIELAQWFAGETSDEVKNIFNQIQIGSTYTIENEAIDTVLLNYKRYVQEEGNREDDDILKKEFQNRELKVLNIACLYASLNHPQDLRISVDDVNQAITTIQFISDDMRLFIEHKPDKFDEYDKFFNFLVKNTGKRFSKTILINNHHNEIGMKRNYLRKNFSDIIIILKEIAELKGYMLKEEYNQKHNGHFIILVEETITEDKKDFKLLNGNVIENALE